MSTSTTELVIAATGAFTSLCGFVFVAVFASLAPWRKSEVGRHVMTLSATLAIVLLLAVYIKLAPGRFENELKIVRSAGVAFVGLLLLKRAQLVVKAQRRRKAGGNTTER